MNRKFLCAVRSTHSFYVLSCVYVLTSHCSYRELSFLIILTSIYLQFAMEPNYLHIWPRNAFMMISLPNLVSMAAFDHCVYQWPETSTIVHPYRLFVFICISFLTAGQDIYLYTLHVFWEFWKNHHGWWSHWVFPGILPWCHTANRRVSGAISNLFYPVIIQMCTPAAFTAVTCELENSECQTDMVCCSHIFLN